MYSSSTIITLSTDIAVGKLYARMGLMIIKPETTACTYTADSARILCVYGPPSYIIRINILLLKKSSKLTEMWGTPTVKDSSHAQSEPNAMCNFRGKHCPLADNVCTELVGDLQVHSERLLQGKCI